VTFRPCSSESVDVDEAVGLADFERWASRDDRRFTLG
jgi:hypothetical protein